MLRSNRNTKFSSMPNFRNVNTDDASPKLFRSSRPDFLTPAELTTFKELGIKSIIDFRSVKEYQKASGTKLLDTVFPTFEVKFIKKGFGRLPDGEVHPVAPASKVAPLPNTTGRHFLINFFQLNYVWAKFNQAPIWFRLFSLLYLVYDFVFNTGYVNFVRAFAKQVLNKEGLLGQYVDIITLSQEPIRAALCLLTDPDNIPAVINCAHGKDRTGIVSALVLSCMGKSREYIAKNYAQSELELEFMKERLHREIVDHLHMDKSFTTAKEKTMMDLLNYMDDTYGSVSQYLQHIGFTKYQQEQLKQNLLPKDQD